MNTTKPQENSELVSLLRSLRQFSGEYVLSGDVLDKIIRQLDPWVRIDPERPETLPPYTEYTKILITQLVEGKPTSKQGYYDGLQFRQINGSFIPLSSVVSWQPWPQPAVYEESE